MNKILSRIFDINKNIRIRRHVKRKFYQESLLMHGKHNSNNGDQSILFFTAHRCASRYVKNIMKQLSNDIGMTIVDIESYFWFGGQLHIRPEKVYKKCGYIYGPFMNGISLMGSEESLAVLPKYKTFIEKMKRVAIPNLDDFKIVLMLRDPRDLLTSYYFHHAYEVYDNPADDKIVKERSRDALSKTIDDWVLEQSHIFLKRYQVYLSHLKKRPNTLLLRYEDMIYDFSNWLYQLTNIIDPNTKKETIKLIIEKANFKVEREDVSAHKRQVTPGDYKRKLKDETINLLNIQFAEVMSELGYK